MASLGAQPEDVVSRSSHRPCMTVGDYMIRIREAAKPCSIERHVTTSTIGTLDDLPLEVIHLILGQLDFQSISRVSRTSIRANAIVQSLRAYHDMMQYAPQTLVALSRTELITAHKACTLHAALFRQACESCGQFGPFLFLPTCQRCCYTCLDRNQSLWVLPVNKARRYFGLSHREIKPLPTMVNLPGYYCVSSSRKIKRRFRLVSVRSAKELAMQVHGSEAALADLRDAARSAGLSNLEWHDWGWFQYAPLQPLVNNPASTPTEANKPSDLFPGMASIPFPYVSASSGPELGLWCLGCDRWLQEYVNGIVTRAHIDAVPSDVHPRQYLEGERDRAWTRAEFLQHLSKCPGAKE